MICKACHDTVAIMFMHFIGALPERVIYKECRKKLRTGAISRGGLILNHFEKRSFPRRSNISPETPIAIKKNLAHFAKVGSKNIEVSNLFKI